MQVYDSRLRHRRAATAPLNVPAPSSGCIGLQISVLHLAAVLKRPAEV